MNEENEKVKEQIRQNHAERDMTQILAMLDVILGEIASINQKLLRQPTGWGQ